MKLMVIGYARHGKDTVCNYLRDRYGLTFVSSSYFVMERAVKPYLEKMGITYNSLDDCYSDRINHRAKWFDAICEYNKDDPAKLGRELFQNFDVYCGLRNEKEFHALKAERAFDFTFWVDRGLRVEPEPTNSITLRSEHADFVIDNNGDLSYLHKNIETVYGEALKKLHIA